MICFQKNSFNYNYLSALKIATDPLRQVENSRVGPVLNLGQAYFEIGPDDPRLIFLNSRKLNPIFAIVEGVWILQGDNRLIPLQNEISDFAKFSDDGETLAGAYGYRLRSKFDIDQIDTAIEVLKKDPASRRVVLNMYSVDDLSAISKDVPCNTSMFLKIVNGALDLTVINRSNDLYLGLPYNVFVFGLLQRHLAEKLCVPLGLQHHFTDCLHLYQRDVERAKAVVACNSLDDVDLISSRFSWDYSRDILCNIEKIENCVYDNMEGDLGHFMSNFCKNGRQEKKKRNSAYDFPPNFFGFLAKQWLAPAD